LLPVGCLQMNRHRKFKSQTTAPGGLHEGMHNVSLCFITLLLNIPSNWKLTRTKVMIVPFHMNVPQFYGKLRDVIRINSCTVHCR
jgi:hypothetical protein